VAILSNATGAPIWQRIMGGIPGLRWYVEALDMNYGYTYHLSWNQPIDADLRIEVDVTNPETQQVETRVFPPTGTWLGIRRRRYALLAYHLASDAEQAALGIVSETVESTIPQAVGGYAMRQVGSPTGRLRCVAHDPLSPGDVAGNNGPPREPDDPSTDRTAYEAQVRQDEAGVTVFKLSTDQRAAPGVR
ncbi:MAG: hypothetical protein KDA63_11210, partial [Planctomycetales bacterium]|nr:hypothetical protein [Planctomycetales bacterium]